MHEVDAMYLSGSRIVDRSICTSIQIRSVVAQVQNRCADKSCPTLRGTSHIFPSLIEQFWKGLRRCHVGLRCDEASQLWHTSLAGSFREGQDAMAGYASFLEQHRWQITTRRPFPVVTLGKGRSWVKSYQWLERAWGCGGGG